MSTPRASRRYQMRVSVLGRLGALLLRLLAATWRVRISGGDPFQLGTGFVAATWHRGLLVAAAVWRDRGIAVPVSRSRDGDLIDAALGSLGFAESPRGSSSRGATSLLRSLIRRVREGENVAMLPDGPRGPAGQAKPGVIALARATGVPIVPVGLAAAPSRSFRSWDRALLPLPFARVRCHYGNPIRVPKRATAEEMEALRGELQTTLDRLDEAMTRSLQPNSHA